MQIVEGIAGATGIQLDVSDHARLCKYISQVQLSSAFFEVISTVIFILSEASCSNYIKVEFGRQQYLGLLAYLML